MNKNKSNSNNLLTIPNCFFTHTQIELRLFIVFVPIGTYSLV